MVTEKHGTLNSDRGVIFLQVDRWIIEEVLVGPPDQYVSHPRRTARNPLTTLTMFLTFETLTLLERVGILCIRFIVKPCLPNPMLCFRYQNIIHTQVHCTFDISPERGTKCYCDTMCLRTYPIYNLFFTSHILLTRR